MAAIQMGFKPVTLRTKGAESTNVELP